MAECFKVFDPECYEVKKQHVMFRLQSWATWKRSNPMKALVPRKLTSSVGQMAAESVTAKRNRIGLIRYLVWLCKDCDTMHTLQKPETCKKCGGERFRTSRVNSISGKRVYASMIHDTSHEQNYLLDMETDTAIDMMDPLLRAIIFSNYLNENNTQEEKAENLEMSRAWYKQLLNNAHSYLIGYFDSKLFDNG